MAARSERYNVIALFDDERRAKAAVKRLDEAGVDRDRVRLLHPSGGGDSDRIAELRAEMQDEVVGGVAGPGVGLMTPAQAKGAIWGTLGGVIVGAILGFVIGFVWTVATHASSDAAVRITLVTVAFAIAGAISGAVTGGSLKPRMDAEERPVEMDDKKMAAEADTLVAVHVTDIGVARRAKRLLAAAGAERVDAVNADGRPLPPQAEHPRPADPPGRWWRKGARG